MALRLGYLHDALTAAHGVEPDLAKMAAEEVAAFDARMSKVEADLAVLKWMVGALLGLQIALGLGNLWLSMNILSRLR